jgi:hypothetical protein
MIVRARSICSRIAGSRMMMLRRAASEIDPMIATGMPMSRGHGVATTSTARKRTGSPLHNHAPRPMPRAIGVYQAPSWSPSRRSAGRRCSESRITFMIRA